MMEYLPSRKASQLLNLHPNTLRRLADTGKIDYIKTDAGHRRYNVQDYITKNKLPSLGKIKICYCRVSSAKQRDDLNRQIKFMQECYPEHEIISDIGSSLNYKRKGLQTLLERINRREVEEVVVTYKDRLSRFGFELIEQFLKLNNGKLVVLNKTSVSQEKELAEDLISIITIFSARVHGSRRYKKSQEAKTNSEQTTAGDLEEMVWGGQIDVQLNFTGDEEISKENILSDSENSNNQD